MADKKKKTIFIDPFFFDFDGSQRRESEAEAAAAAAAAASSASSASSSSSSLSTTSKKDGKNNKENNPIKKVNIHAQNQKKKGKAQLTACKKLLLADPDISDKMMQDTRYQTKTAEDKIKQFAEEIKCLSEANFQQTVERYVIIVMRVCEKMYPGIDDIRTELRIPNLDPKYDHFKKQKRLAESTSVRPMKTVEPSNRYKRLALHLEKMQNFDETDTGLKDFVAMKSRLEERIRRLGAREKCFELKCECNMMQTKLNLLKKCNAELKKEIWSCCVSKFDELLCKVDLDEFNSNDFSNWRRIRHFFLDVNAAATTGRNGHDQFRTPEARRAIAEQQTNPLQRTEMNRPGRLLPRPSANVYDLCRTPEGNPVLRIPKPGDKRHINEPVRGVRPSDTISDEERERKVEEGKKKFKAAWESLHNTPPPDPPAPKPIEAPKPPEPQPSTSAYELTVDEHIDRIAASMKAKEREEAAYEKSLRERNAKIKPRKGPLPVHLLLPPEYREEEEEVECVSRGTRFATYNPGCKEPCDDMYDGKKLFKSPQLLAIHERFLANNNGVIPKRPTTMIVNEYGDIVSDNEFKSIHSYARERNEKLAQKPATQQQQQKKKAVDAASHFAMLANKAKAKKAAMNPPQHK